MTCAHEKSHLSCAYDSVWPALQVDLTQIQIKLANDKINRVKLKIKLAQVKIDFVKVEFNLTKVRVNLAK